MKHEISNFKHGTVPVISLSKHFKTITEEKSYRTRSQIPGKGKPYDKEMKKFKKTLWEPN
jgi:hypothetical protein